MEGEQTRRVELGGDVGERELHALQARDGAAEGGALLVRRPRPARGRARAMPQACAAMMMRPPSRVASATFSPCSSSPIMVARAEAVAVEGQLRGRRRVQAHLRQLAAEVKPSPRSARKHETPFGAGPAGAREEDEDVGEAAVGDPCLGAVDAPAVAVGGRGRADRGRVRAGVGLGQGIGAERSPVASRGRYFSFCSAVPARSSGAAPSRVCTATPAEVPASAARDLLDDQRQRV